MLGKPEGRESCAPEVCQSYWFQFNAGEPRVKRRTRGDAASEALPIGSCKARAALGALLHRDIRPFAVAEVDLAGPGDLLFLVEQHFLPLR